MLHLIQRIPMFRGLQEGGERELLRLVPYVRTRTYSAGERLLTEAFAPDRTIILLTGRVVLRKTFEHSDPTFDSTPEVRELGHAGPGTVLGRTSLALGGFEQLTVVAVEESQALVLLFRDLVRAYQGSAYLREHMDGPLKPERLVSTLQHIPAFSQLTDSIGSLELYQVARITHEQYYEDSEWVFRQGEISDRLIQVLEGQVQLSLVDAEGLVRNVKMLKPGDLMGETGLLVGDFHDVTAIAGGHARLLYILRSEFAELLAERRYLQRRLNISAPVARLRRLRRFDWLRDDEWVIEVAQRHWTRLARQIAIPAFLLLLLLPATLVLLLNGSTASIIIAVILGAPLLVMAGGIAWRWFNWLDDYFIITTQRVLHIERVWPRSSHMEETPLDNIEDIYEAQPTLTANVLNYGTLILQTAGETVDIDMTHVPDPKALRELITRQIERSRARDVLKTRGQIRDMLARRLQTESAPEAVESPPSADTSKPITRSPVALFLAPIRDFFFPPSKIELQGGKTIIWRRYWFPGLRFYGLPFLALAVSSIGGVALLTLPGIAAAFWVWFVGWLLLETILVGILMWYMEDWRNDYFELTPTHVIRIERLPLLLRESRHEARLDRIQNLSYEVPNILARIFKYGHVEFETAGTEGKFVLHYVRYPEEVQATISNRQYQYRQSLRQAEANRRQQELLTWFATYDELHRDTSQS